MTRHSAFASLRITTWACGLGVGIVVSPTAGAAEFMVSSAADINAAMQNAQAGDTLVMTNGTWIDQNIEFAGQGTAGNEITLRAQTPGGVTLTGNSRLSISGSHLVVDGLNFENGDIGAQQSIIQFRGSQGHATHSRLTNTQIRNYNPTDPDTRAFWVSLYGQNNRVDHSSFRDQTNSGVTVVAWLDGQPANHRIDSNYFADREQGDANGFETIRIGTSEFGSTNANVIVENNLFERTDGETEIISNKSNDNIYRYNTFRESAGTLTLRHGHRGTVEGNFFLGEGKSRTGGIRIIGEDHTVINNYIADVDDRAGGAISISAGIPNSPDAGYQQVKNAQIINNTIVNVDGPAIIFDAGLGTRDRTLLAEDVTVTNNLIYSTDAPLFTGQEGSGWTWDSNIAFGASLGITPRAGLIEVDPLLVQGADGLYRPGPNSPALDAGTAVSSVNVDMDGQARIGVIDIGADEFSTAQIVRKPLTTETAGTTWGQDSSSILLDYVVIEAEDFSNVLDPDSDGDVWELVPDSEASNGAAISAPSGSRTDLAQSAHDTLALYDLTFNEAGDYTAYYRARGFSTATNSFFTPTDFATDPDLNETVSSDGVFAWEVGDAFTVTSTHVGMPLELRLGKREGLTQLDAIIFH
ncbi:MAG: polysaccharide lyase 6 family protein, partial [Planctomycetota bacterium]